MDLRMHLSIDARFLGACLPLISGCVQAVCIYICDRAVSELRRFCACSRQFTCARASRYCLRELRAVDGGSDCIPLLAKQHISWTSRIVYCLRLQHWCESIKRQEARTDLPIEPHRSSPYPSSCVSRRTAAAVNELRPGSTSSRLGVGRDAAASTPEKECLRRRLRLPGTNMPRSAGGTCSKPFCSRQSRQRQMGNCIGAKRTFLVSPSTPMTTRIAFLRTN